MLNCSKVNNINNKYNSFVLLLIFLLEFLFSDNLFLLFFFLFSISYFLSKSCKTLSVIFKSLVVGFDKKGKADLFGI